MFDFISYHHHFFFLVYSHLVDRSQFIPFHLSPASSRQIRSCFLILSLSLTSRLTISHLILLYFIPRGLFLSQGHVTLSQQPISFTADCQLVNMEGPGCMAICYVLAEYLVHTGPATNIDNFVYSLKVFLFLSTNETENIMYCLNNNKKNAVKRRWEYKSLLAAHTGLTVEYVDLSGSDLHIGSPADVGSGVRHCRPGNLQLADNRFLC